MDIKKFDFKKLLSIGACLYVAVSAFLDEHHSQQQEKKIEEMEARLSNLEKK